MSTTLIMILLPMLALLTVAGVGYAFVGTSNTNANAKKRIQNIKQGTAVTSTQNKAQQKERDRRKTVQKTLKDLEERQKEEKARISLQTRIEQAGLKFTPVVYWIGSLVLGVIGFLLLFTSGVHVSVAVAAGAAAALGLPRWLLNYLTLRRQKVFLEEFSNALDVIVRGVKAGLPLSECLNIVARESPDPVGSEFRRVVEGARVGVTLEEGLTRMYERMPVPEVNFFVIVLSIQQKSGGNLSEALGNLSNVLRERKLMRGKIQAMSSEAKASAGIIGSLPPGVMGLIYVSTPSYIQVLFSEQVGNIILIAGAAWMALGVLVMKKMINFNF
jgi:tight adherence protein B